MARRTYNDLTFFSELLFRNNNRVYMYVHSPQTGKKILKKEFEEFSKTFFSSDPLYNGRIAA